MQDNHKGSSVLTGVLVFLVVVLAGLSGWAVYAYIQERNTVQEQIQAAETAAREDQQAQAEEQFEEERRNPFRTYTAPDVFGTVEIDFPKNWNVYVEDTTSGSTQIDLYIHPDMIRMHDSEHPFAFRMQLIDRLFDDETSDYRRDVERDEMQADTIQVSGVEGVRYRGELDSGFEGVLVALPFRDKTILLWTEGDSYRDEFNQILDAANINL